MQMKFYSPLTADLFPNDTEDLDDDYSEYEGIPYTGKELTGYRDVIRDAIYEDVKDFYGDLMRYYREDDSVRRKVVRAVLTVDEVNGELVGSLWVDTDAPLTAEEQAVFCAYISGQYSDGWGEGFEQREIDVGDGKLYVHFWQDHDFELKRDVPDMTEFKKLLNRPKKPKMQLIGQDGNIFAIMGRASRLLKSSGQGDKAKEMLGVCRACSVTRIPRTASMSPKSPCSSCGMWCRSANRVGASLTLFPAQAPPCWPLCRKAMRLSASKCRTPISNAAQNG